MNHVQKYQQYYKDHGRLAEKPPEHLEFVEQLMVIWHCKDILDYGCGAARGLSRFSQFPVHDYDPGVHGLGVLKPADLVVCNHVLEHVENLDAALDVIRDCVRNAKLGVFITVSCEKSTKLLPDGTPWHSLVMSPDSWVRVFRDEFPSFQVYGTPDGKSVIATFFRGAHEWPPTS